jgi:hypothetical protein
LAEWIKLIISPGSAFGIPLVDQHKFQIFAAVACDILWFYRNKAYHDGISYDAISVSKHINKITLEHFQAWHSSTSTLEDTWTPPSSNWVKINFDTAIRDFFSTQVAICRDDKGHILQAISQINFSCSPNEGEAMAAQLAISLAISLKKECFIIEVDSEMVVLSLKNPNFVRDWRISTIILNSLESIPSTSFWEVTKISRSANFCAHSMACWAAARSYSGSITMSSFPTLITASPSTDPPLYFSLM